MTKEQAEYLENLLPRFKNLDEVKAKIVELGDSLIKGTVKTEYSWRSLWNFDTINGFLDWFFHNLERADMIGDYEKTALSETFGFISATDEIECFNIHCFIDGGVYSYLMCTTNSKVVNGEQVTGFEWYLDTIEIID